MTAIIVFCSLSCLLFFGKILRMKLRLLQRLYLPSSVVGGLIGLALVQCLGSHLPAELVGTTQKLPGFLINVIFATLFLGAAHQNSARPVVWPPKTAGSLNGPHRLPGTKRLYNLQKSSNARS